MRSLPVPAVDAGEKSEFGPAMQKLNPQQRAFVVAMFECGGNQTDAARAAGYMDKGNGSIRVTARRLMQRPDVKAAFQEFGRSHIVAYLPMAIDRVVAEIENPQSKEGLKAAFGVMNRAGMHELVERNVNINVTMTAAEKEADIRTMAEVLGLNAAQLLGQVTDAEFEEVPEGMEDIW